MAETVIDIVPVEPKFLDIVWPQVRELLDQANAVANGEINDEVMLEKISEGRWILLAVVENKSEVIAAVTLDIQYTFPSGKKILAIGSAGGTKMDLWLDEMYSVVKTYAGHFGAEELYINGREGWGRVLKDKGFRKVYSTFVKEL